DDGVPRRTLAQPDAVAIAQRVLPGDICADVVPLDKVAGAGPVNADVLVPRDDVASRRGCSADCVAAGSTVDLHSTPAIGQRSRAGGISANVSALDQVGDGAAEYMNAVAAVTGDDVAGAGDRSTHHVIRGKKRDAPAVPKSLHSSDVRADVVAFDHISRTP